MSTVEQQVKKIVAEQLGVKEEEVTNDASFVDDLGADSLEIRVRPTMRRPRLGSPALPNPWPARSARAASRPM